MPIIYHQKDKWTASYSLEADERRLHLIPIYWISEQDVRDEFLSKCIKAWKLEEVDWDPLRRRGCYAKTGIQAFIVRRLVRLGHYYWWFIGEILYKRLHLISRKGREGYMFSWREDFKPIRFIRRIRRNNNAV